MFPPPPPFPSPSFLSTAFSQPNFPNASRLSPSLRCGTRGRHADRTEEAFSLIASSRGAVCVCGICTRLSGVRASVQRAAWAQSGYAAAANGSDASILGGGDGGGGGGRRCLVSRAPGKGSYLDSTIRAWGARAPNKARAGGLALAQATGRLVMSRSASSFVLSLLLPTLRLLRPVSRVRGRLQACPVGVRYRCR